MFRIKGEYRDVISRHGVPLEDRGWRSNSIVADFGLFLAALLKKQYSSPVGLEYLAVGEGAQEGSVSQRATAFKARVETFFDNITGPSDLDYYQEVDGKWVWAKMIKGSDISYIDEEENPTNDVTNTLQIIVDIEAGTPLKRGSGEAETLKFTEFALLGIKETDSDTLRMVNYVSHGVIEKDTSMKLTREIRLKFPVEGS